MATISKLTTTGQNLGNALGGCYIILIVHFEDIIKTFTAEETEIGDAGKLTQHNKGYIM